MLHAIILAGGSGTRFWPQSRRELPKQFLKLTGEKTLIQETAGRCSPLIPPERIWVITNAALASETARQLPDIPSTHILVEPCARNTAPCIGLAAIQLLAVDPEATMLVMPADHVIETALLFQSAVKQAVETVIQFPETLMLLGVQPTTPATGFGYIRRGVPVASVEATDVCQVISFQEKPDRVTALHYLESGEYYWNSGIFVWRSHAFLDAIKKWAPEVHAILESLRVSLHKPLWCERLEAEFPSMPSISIDYAVLEKASPVCVLKAPFLWDDVGSWHALSRLIASDETANTLDGLVCTVSTSGCIVKTTGDHLVATVGIQDLIIVHTPTATLVADKRDEGSLRLLISELEKKGLQEYL